MVNNREVVAVRDNDIAKGFVFGTLIVGTKLGEEEGNLELDLAGVDSVENAVETSVIEGGVEFVFLVGFGGGDFDIVIDFDTFGFVIIGKFIGTAGEGGREGTGDRTEAGRFELGVILSDNGVDVDSAEI